MAHTAARKDVLYVESDPEDVCLLRHAFEAEGMKEWLHVAQDGLEAIEWLQGDSEYVDRRRFPLPRLVLLALRLAKLDGMEVLRWIRSEPVYASLPVIVFSGLFYDEEIKEAYRHGANVFLEKPASREHMRQVARFVGTWLQHGLPPPEDESHWEAVRLHDLAECSRRLSHGRANGRNR